MAGTQRAHAVLHCNLNAADLDAAEAFYAGLLRLRGRMRSVSTDGDATVMGLGTGTASTTAFLYDARGPRAAPAVELVGWQRPPTARVPLPAGAPGPVALGFRVTDLGAVTGRTAGGLLLEPVDGGVRVRGALHPAARASDPDGVAVEVVEIADPSTEDPSAGLVSHERLRVTDVDLSTDWYAALGWEVRARGDGAGDEPSWASLVLPEDPTFSLELEGAGPGQPAAEGSARPANAQGLYRIAIAVEDVATAHAELTAAGAELPDPVFFPMPDVPTGGFTALFLRDPDGFTVELVDRPRSAVRRPTEPR